MDDMQRHAYLETLGLVDWQVRSFVQAPAVGQPAESEPPAEQAHARALGATPKNGPPSETTGKTIAAMEWAELEAHLGGCDTRGAQRPVFGTGARDADLLVIGEAPGAEEDKLGLPFVGRAGKLLDRMLFAIGRSRGHNVYITNICKFRPPGNRDPNTDEVAADWPILERQIELLDPGLVVAVGKVAAQTLLGGTASLGAMRGLLHRYPHRDLPVLVTYHPAYLLRSPQQKAKSWDDLKRVAKVLRDGQKQP